MRGVADGATLSERLEARDIREFIGKVSALS
jgi:hypothetical protein